MPTTHSPRSEQPDQPEQLFGRAEPRLWTPAARRLTRRTTRGYEVADFADKVLGEPLLPWQDWLVKHALELNPDGGFRFRVILVLVGRQNGKTHVLRTVSLWRMFVDNARLILGAAQSLDIAREAWQACVDTSKSVPWLAERVDTVRYANGEQCLTLDNGARYRITAATRGAGRGLSVDQLNLDELREQTDWLAWAALSKTTQARANGQIWAISNAGDDKSVVLNHLINAGRGGTDPTVFLAEWSAPDGCDLDDWDAIAQANPGLGYTVSAAAIRTSMTTDPPAVYRTEVLCQHVSALDEAVDLAAWRDCADPAGSLTTMADRVVACLDVAPDGQHVTLAVAAPLGDGRVRVEIAAAWNDTSAARNQLPALLDQIQPTAVAWYPSGPAAALAPLLRPRRGSVELTGGKVAAACQGFADLVRARRILHSDDPLGNAHVSGATRLHQGDGWRFARTGGVGHVDAAYALAGAADTALTLPRRPRGRACVLVGRRPAA